MEDNVDIIDYIVQSCVKIMKEHSYTETIYVDYFESNENCLNMTTEEIKYFKEKYNKTPEEIMNIELVTKDNTSFWEEILSEHYMSKDDFICNIILLTLLEICYDIKIKYNDKSKCSASKLNDKYYKYIWDNGDIPDRKRIKRRETAVLETKQLHYDADELKNNNLKNSSILGKLQERLVFHEIICGNIGKETNPLIKLANSPSLSTHHFMTDES